MKVSSMSYMDVKQAFDRVLEQVLTTSAPVQFEFKGKKLALTLVEVKDKLARLEPRILILSAAILKRLSTWIGAERCIMIYLDTHVVAWLYPQLDKLTARMPVNRGIFIFSSSPCSSFSVG